MNLLLGQTEGGCMATPQRAIGFCKRTKKIEIIPHSFYYLSDPIANNEIKVRHSVINKILWIDSRMSGRVLLSLWGKPNNYL